MIDLTVYRGARDPKPIAQDTLSWPDFCAEITALCAEESVATDKRDLPAIGPYRLRPGANRSIAGVEHMGSVVALDLDGADLDSLRARLTELGLDAIIHGSPSDDPNGARKLRCYVRADGPHTPADAGRVRDSVAALLGVAHDPATRNADRLFFCGRLAGTDARYVETFAGQPVSLASLPSVPAPAPATKPKAEIAPHASAAQEAAAWAIVGVLGDWQDYAGRKHAVCGAIGGVLRRLPGWTREHCAQILRAWLPALEPGVDVDAGVRYAQGAWDRTPDEVSGEQALAGLVGADRARAIVESALVPWRVKQDTTVASVTPADDSSDYVVMRVADWRNPAPLRYVVPFLEFAPGKVSVIQGYAYTSKTPLALTLAICIASGKPFLGHEVLQGPVIYLDHEGGLLTRERATRICAGLGLDPDVIPLTLFTPEGQFSELYLAELERLSQELGAIAVIVDTYASALPADSGGFNDSNFRVWADALGRYSTSTNTLVVLLIHENKAARGQEGLRGISGHGSLAGAVQAALALERESEDQPHTITLRCARATYTGYSPLRIVWSDPDCDGAPLGKALVCAVADGSGGATDAALPARGAAPANAARAAKATAETVRAGSAIMRDISRETWVARKELRALGGSQRAADRALERLVAAGLLEVRAGSYAITPAGKCASALTVARALGSEAGFTR